MSLILVCVLCLQIFVLAVTRPATSFNNRIVAWFLIGALGVLAVAAAATAEVSVSDRGVYLKQASILSVTSLRDSFSAVQTDPLFVPLVWLLTRITPGHPKVLFVGVAAICAVSHVVAMRLIFEPWQTAVVWLTLLSTGLFASYSNVALRQGLAIAVVMVALSLYIERRGRWSTFLLLLVAAGLLHWSAAFVGAGLVILRLIKPSLRTLLLLWCGLVVVFVTAAQQLIFGRLLSLVPAVQVFASSDTLDSYGDKVNRLDFLLVGVVLVVVALVGIRLVGDDPVYRRMVSAFLVLQCYFLVLGFVAFSDRIAAYSWFLAPALVWYPLLKSRTPRTVALSAVAMMAVLALGLASGTLVSMAQF